MDSIFGQFSDSMVERTMRLNYSVSVIIIGDDYVSLTCPIFLQLREGTVPLLGYKQPCFFALMHQSKTENKQKFSLEPRAGKKAAAVVAMETAVATLTGKVNFQQQIGKPKLTPFPFVFNQFCLARQNGQNEQLQIYLESNSA